MELSRFYHSKFESFSVAQIRSHRHGPSVEQMDTSKLKAIMQVLATNTSAWRRSFVSGNVLNDRSESPARNEFPFAKWGKRHFDESSARSTLRRPSRG
jgi:hypothetical protein